MQAAMAARDKDGRYLAAWPSIAANLSSANRDTRQQWAALLGDEATALADAAHKGRTVPDLTGARAQEAIAAVVRASAGRRVVILNEAHVASRHRLFLASVARALRGEGFTHLAAETFTNFDTPRQSPIAELRAGASLRPGHGYYLNDPVYAEAVREALDLGYRLVSYEQVVEPGQLGASPQSGVPAREQAQAENLAAALKRFPTARFLVHVGYGHLSKRAFGLGPMMAEQLQAITGVNPMTIQQDATGSFAPHAEDDATTRAVLARFTPSGPIAVFAADGAALNSKSVACDLTVFHPGLPDVDGRPGWLARAEGRRRTNVRLPAPAPSGYVLAQAVPATDPDPAIPADQYLLVQGARDVVFHLRPGRYRVRLETPDGFTPIGLVRA